MNGSVQHFGRGGTLSEGPAPLWEQGRLLGHDELDAISLVLRTRPRQSGRCVAWEIDGPSVRETPTSLELHASDPESLVALIHYADGAGRRQARVIDSIERIENRSVNGTGVLALSYGDQTRRTVIELSSTGAYRESLDFPTLPDERPWPPEGPSWMPIREVTTQLGLGRTAVLYLARRGTLHARKIGDMWFIDPEAVRSYRPRRSANRRSS